MRCLLAISLSLATMLIMVPSARLGSVEYAEFSLSRPMKRTVKWPRRRIAVALSTSLNTPGPNFKLGTDIPATVRRALARWAAITNITFVESVTATQSVSSGSGDGVSLITIADTRENNAIFTDAEMTGRTRVFYDLDTGAISEADICINPHPSLSDGTPVQFSTDGTPGTYDLESTITHEIGHLLGLDHSAVVASTMQARQGLNGVYGLPAFTGRTPSEEDRERIRSLYGPHEGEGALVGKVSDKLAGSQVWAESTSNGRVAGSTFVQSDGTYRFDAVMPGQYRLLLEASTAADDSVKLLRDFSTNDSERLSRATEITAQATVLANSTTVVGSNEAASAGAAQYLSPRYLGLNGDLSTVALPLEAGKKTRIYLAGEGLDQIPSNGISIASPFFKVEPAKLSREQFNSSLPVVGFDVSIAANAPFGDFSIRLQSISGEVAYVAGAITIDPGAASSSASPVDDAHFFVGQHYRDVLGREADRAGLEYWANQLQQCGTDANCLRTKRLAISSAFLSEPDFQAVGSFIYGLYKTVGRRPTFGEFSEARDLIGDSSSNSEGKLKELASDFVTRPEFIKKYPAGMTAEKFVESLLAESSQTSSERSSLIALYDGKDSGRAAILERVVASPAFTKAEYNRVFVLMQYFVYLRRDPDESGYAFWLDTLQTKPTTSPNALRSVTCAFVNSAEYQSRFGMAITHTSAECSR